MKNIIILIKSFISLTLYAQSKPIESIPFKVEKNQIYIYAKVNKTDSLRFLFDTGANGSVINQESTRKVKLKIDGKSINTGSNGTNEVEESSNNEMILGTIHKKDILFTIIPFESDEFDGIIGTDIMREHIIEIDYHKQIINFYEKNDKNIDYNGYTKLKMSSDIYPTYIKSTLLIKGKKYKGLFGLDTGADDVLTLTSRFSRNNNFANKMRRIGSDGFIGSDGLEYEMPIFLCPEIEFVKKYFYNIPTALSNATEGIDASDKLAGFYGNAFLKKFNIILNYNSNFIYLKLNKNLYTDFYEE